MSNPEYSDKSKTVSEAAMERQNRALRACFWLVAILLGGAQAWLDRHTVAEDGLSYIEIGEAYFRGDWKNAINAYWSPLYSWILGFALRIVQPARVFESSVVHFVNFLLYVCALIAFDYFLRQLLRYKQERARSLSEQQFITLSDRAWIVLGYGLFLYSALNWITVSIETPDMLLSVFLYLTAGTLIRLRLGATDWLTFGVLGIILGLGYLSKSALFPLTFVILAVSFFLVGNARKALPRVALSLAAFLTVAPFMIMISMAKGRPTFGDAGRLTYAWYTNGDGLVDQIWHLEFPDDKRPEHPTRKIYNEPAIYEYGSEIAGTYPPYYDPSYWHSGVVPHFDLRGQVSVVKRSIRRYLMIFFEDMRFFIFGALILFLTAGRFGEAVKRIAQQWLFLVPSLAAFAMYGLVRVSPRYVAAFVVFFWVGIFLSVRLRDSKECRRLMDAVAVGIVLLMMVQFMPDAYRMASAFRHDVNASQSWQWKIAEGLRRAGIQPGDKVAVVGYAPSAYWARLAQVQVVAEVFSEEMEFLSVKHVDEMLSPSGALEPAVVQAFVRTGARALIAKNVPSDVSRNGWQELGIAPWFVYPLPR